MTKKFKPGDWVTCTVEGYPTIALGESVMVDHDRTIFDWRVIWGPGYGAGIYESDFELADMKRHMKRHKLTRSTFIQATALDSVEWPLGTTVWTTGETDPDGTVEVVPYPGSEFRVWFRPSDLRPTEDA